MNTPNDPAAYRILHDNGQEYGPVSAEALRGWIREGRAHARTRVKAEGAADWRWLGDLPEFGAEVHSAAAPPVADGKTSGMAITSLVLGILGLVSCGVTSVIGLIVGIVSLVKINRSQGRLRGAGLAIAAIVVSTVFLLLMPLQLAIAIPNFIKARQTAQSTACSNNLKQLALAALLYEADHGVLPSTNWPFALPLNGYVSSTVLQCPAEKSAARGYALNSAVAEKAVRDLDPSLVLFFESDQQLTPCGGKELMMAQPRHGNGFNIGFVDGSVRQVGPGQVATLRWEP